jgi:hypothetical protein
VYAGSSVLNWQPQRHTAPNHFAGQAAKCSEVQAELAGAASTFCCCGCALQIAEMEAVVRQSQSYAQTLQNYNTSLQTDVQVRWLAGMPYAVTAGLLGHAARTLLYCHP